MTHISTLISNLRSAMPLNTQVAANNFLARYTTEDQCALISSMYIGRDHIHDTKIRADYIPEGIHFDRYFTTGSAPKWDIPPARFSQILYEKGLNLNAYYDAFERCCQNSAVNLAQF